MARASLKSATLTGAFCCGFTVIVGWLTVALSMWHLVVLSFVSGFLGSLFAHWIQTGQKARKGQP